MGSEMCIRDSIVPECNADATHVVHVDPEKAGTGEMGGMWRRWWLGSGETEQMLVRRA